MSQDISGDSLEAEVPAYPCVKAYRHTAFLRGRKTGWAKHGDPYHPPGLSKKMGPPVVVVVEDEDDDEQGEQHRHRERHGKGKGKKK